MFSNTAQTQQDVLHPVSHSALNVLHRVYKGMMPMHHKNLLQFFDNSPTRMMAPSAMPGSKYPPPSLKIQPFSEPPTDALLLPGTCFTFSS
jgi:hypothetical protein